MEIGKTAIFLVCFSYKFSMDEVVASACAHVFVLSKALHKVSRSGDCSSRMYCFASSKENQRPLSISGISRRRPERGGHSISHVLLFRFAGSQSPSNAHAATHFPLFCLIVPRSRNDPAALKPVSSSNSRRAAASGFSSSSYSPLGMVHAPSFFLAQMGPP